MYILFAWDQYYPSGGHRDIVRVINENDEGMAASHVFTLFDSIKALPTHERGWLNETWELYSVEQQKVVRAWELDDRWVERPSWHEIQPDEV